MNPVADWNKPAKVSCILPERSGDQKKYQPQPKTSFVNEFAEKSEELKTADDIVREMFTFEYQPKILEARRSRSLEVKKVQRHDLDFGSMEAKSELNAELNLLSSSILILQSHFSRQDDSQHQSISGPHGEESIQ